MRTVAGCLAALVLVGRGVPALADPTPLVTPPAGWRADPEHASALAQRFAATSHFGGLPAETAAEAYVADQPGAALFATRATATLTSDQAQVARAARAALDALRASSRRAGLTGGAAEEQSWQEQVETDARQVTATLAWHDPTSHAAESARVVVASDGKRIVAVTGECVVGDTAAPDLVAACRASLTTLAAGIGPAQRVPISLAATSAGEEPSSPSGPGRAANRAAPRANEAASPGDGSAPGRRAQSTMSAASAEPTLSDERVRLPPMAIPQDPRSNDRRTAYVGAGVIVLAVMFWWNRRRRDRFEREDRGAPPRRAARDDDADDLHAAAHSDTPEASDRPDRRHRPNGRDRRDP